MHSQLPRTIPSTSHKSGYSSCPQDGELHSINSWLKEQETQAERLKKQQNEWGELFLQSYCGVRVCIWSYVTQDRGLTIFMLTLLVHTMDY